MLPSILHIAEQYNLISDSRTYGEKESLFKCPFCKQDSLPENKKKFYLSLNTKDNVFKCWYCDESGGVLRFEALLSHKPYEVIRRKYFGERKENLHPAYKLTPDQLREIGWQSRKRDNFQGFLKNRDRVIEDWKEYERQELVKHYALFTLIAHFPIKNDRRDHYEWFVEVCQDSKVDQLSNKIVQQWNSPKKMEWAVEGNSIAEMAITISYETGDFEFDNLFLNVLFIQELLKYKEVKEQEHRGNPSISI